MDHMDYLCGLGRTTRPASKCDRYLTREMREQMRANKNWEKYLKCSGDSGYVPLPPTPVPGPYTTEPIPPGGDFGLPPPVPTRPPLFEGGPMYRPPSSVYPKLQGLGANPMVDLSGLGANPIVSMNGLGYFGAEADALAPAPDHTGQCEEIIWHAQQIASRLSHLQKSLDKVKQRETQVAGEIQSGKRERKASIPLLEALANREKSLTDALSKANGTLSSLKSKFDQIVSQVRAIPGMAGMAGLGAPPHHHHGGGGGWRGGWGPGPYYGWGWGPDIYVDVPQVIPVIAIETPDYPITEETEKPEESSLLGLLGCCCM